MSNDAAGLALAANALAKASEAERKADLAERMAFVKGYKHDDATEDERYYYAESVYMLWPVEDDKPASRADREAVAILTLIGLGAAIYGAFFLDIDYTSGVIRFGAALFTVLITAFALLVLYGAVKLISFIFTGKS